MLWLDAFTCPFVLLWCLTVIIAKCKMVQSKYKVDIFIPIYHVDECNACLGQYNPMLDNLHVAFNVCVR
jgi:hypothetical protein